MAAEAVKVGRHLANGGPKPNLASAGDDQVARISAGW
jgi:hypothetical protein